MTGLVLHHGAMTITDPTTLMDRAIALGTGVIAQVTPDQLDRPTPCDAFDVRQLLDHLVVVAERIAAAGRDEHPSTWPLHTDGVADDGWLAAWRAATATIAPAWADAALLDRPTAVPWAVLSGRDMLAIYTNEVTVHTWDLATAIGAEVAWDPDVLAASFAAIQAQMPAEHRAEILAAVLAQAPEGATGEVPFALAVDVPADAPLIDRLVAWNGRQP